MCPLVIIWIFKFIVHQVHTDFSFYFKTLKSASRSDHPEDGIYGVWSLKNWNSVISWFSWFPNDDATMELTSKLFDFFLYYFNIFYFIFKFTNIHFNFNSNSATSDASTAPSTKSSPAISLQFNRAKIELENGNQVSFV